MGTLEKDAKDVVGSKKFLLYLCIPVPMLSQCNSQNGKKYTPSLL